MKSEIKINTEVQTRMGYTIKDFIDSNNFPEMKLISDNSEITRACLKIAANQSF